MHCPPELAAGAIELPPRGTIEHMDAPVLVLEAQLRTLSSALERLTVARRDLVPAPATFWRGRARDAYDRALRDLDDRLGSAIEATRFAQQNTVLAIAEELRHAG